MLRAALWPLALLLALLWSGGARAEDRHRVHLLTMGPGDRLFEVFAHNALLVDDRKTGERILYNYGTFEQASLASLIAFLRARLGVELSARRWSEVAGYYAGRDLIAQELDLLPGQADALVARLDRNARPENSRYVYDPFRDNCSTRIRDQLDRATGGLLERHAGGQPGRRTYRANLDEWLRPTPWLRVLLHFIWAGPVDASITRREEMFLPFALRQAIAELTITHPDGSTRPLVKRETTLMSRTVPRPDRPLWPVWLVVAAALLPGTAALLAGPRLARPLGGFALALHGLLAGLSGTLIAAIWCTGLVEGHRNLNLLYATPLHLSLIPVGLWLATGRLSARTARLVARVLQLQLAVALLELGAHLLGLQHQRHLPFAIYFVPAALLSWLVLLARERQRFFFS